MKLFHCVLIFISVASSLLSQFRYTDSLFNAIQTDNNRIYASAPELNSPYSGESSTHSKNLTMHIFQPENDTLSFRPAVIMIHGGAFVSGTKENQDMMEFCKLFAQEGYVAATIDYRLGMNLTSSKSGERAVYRALQDCRAAVRFLKENRNELRIDTNNIFLIGSSAGAFMTLFNLFMNEESERPASSYIINNFPPNLDNGPNLGKLDAIEPLLKHSAYPRAVVSLWGALKDTTLIKPGDEGKPVFLVHGTTDDIGPFNVGSPFHYSGFPPTYGSNPTNNRLENLGFEKETYFVEGVGHEFYGVVNGNWNPAPNAYWDTINTKITAFFHNIHKPIADFSHEAFDGQIFFTDRSINATKWFWDFGDSTTSNEQNPAHEYSADGFYNVKLFVQNSIDSWDTLSNKIQVITVGMENENIIHSFSLSQNYPNPFNPTTIIAFVIPNKVRNIKNSLTTKQSHNVTLKVYDVLGREVAKLVDEENSAGSYAVKFDARGLSSGIYFYKLQSGSFLETKKMALIK